jgi:cytochrome c-type biogenesis protein CcmE
MQGSYVSAGVALTSVIGLGFVFMMNASPYATIKDVAASTSSGAHVVGQIEPGTIRQNFVKQSLNFTIKDDTGTMPVSYTGSPVSNLESATKVVVIGKYENGVFHARDMQVKCPSKYEAEKSGG